MSVNKVALLGNLGADPKYFTRNSTKMCVFQIATNEVRRLKGTELETRTEWHSLVAFGRTADSCSKYLKKGSKVYVEGSLRSRDYEDKSGTRHRTLNIVVSTCEFLGDAPTKPTKEEEPLYSPEQLAEKDMDAALAELDF